MEERGPDTNSPSHASERSEPVRSRWTPKPEQILILESIFNSGMVNPPKDETVRIRKLLEKFGTVGDANVFYWFQNRRSRSRRRQRQMQAELAGDNTRIPIGANTSGAIQYELPTSSAAACFPTTTSSFSVSHTTHPSSFAGSSSSSCGGGDDGIDDLFSFSHQMGLPEIEQSTAVTSILCPSDTSHLQYQSEFITVFINGIPTEVPRGPLDLKAMFGQDVLLVHSSGVPVPFNEFGISLQSLQPGESYFLVSRTI
ncbi:WUSCHEL-related homeobox 11-like [Macadamia integrifolia]|uniref:WUSCHEL-related homeobox 11-like n=1 Tax=Macadamia integrifolia TaxID=60698 RepID=UPI001C529FF7|nr:WUSCHEL-related homeobox 11-like [Macadamia integrifolia]